MASKSPWQENPKIFLGGRRILDAFFGGSGGVSRAPGGFRGVEDSAWSAKRPVFTRLWPGFAPEMGDNCPAFASHNPRFSDYVIQRRGWNCRFPANFGTGFARRGGGGSKVQSPKFTRRSPEESRRGEGGSPKGRSLPACGGSKVGAEMPVSAARTPTGSLREGSFEGTGTPKGSNVKHGEIGKTKAVW